MDNRFLITNDFGNYSFLTNKQFYNLLKDQMDPSDDDEKKTELIEKGFISAMASVATFEHYEMGGGADGKG